MKKENYVYIRELGAYARKLTSLVASDKSHQLEFLLIFAHFLNLCDNQCFKIQRELVQVNILNLVVPHQQKNLLQSERKNWIRNYDDISLKNVVRNAFIFPKFVSDIRISSVLS